MPCLVKADGTIIAPTAETWKIRNDSPQPVTLDTAVADTITPGTSITAKSQPTTLYEDDTGDGKGSYTISIDDTGNETRTEGGTDEHPVQIAPGESLGFDWDVQLPTHLLNCAPPQPITVADISMTFKTIRKTAFAVYSEDDHSLDFYKRIRIPQVGETLNGKTVTNIYTGFETTGYECVKVGETYGAPYEDDAIINTPWYDRRYDIESVEVLDGGIQPEYLDYWFMNFTHCKALKLNRLDTSRCRTMCRTFNRCRTATDIEISKWDTSNTTSLYETFLECNTVETLDISGWVCPKNTSLHSTWNNCNKLREIRFNENWTTQNVKRFSCTFWATAFERLDLSSWDFDKAEYMAEMLGYMKSLREIDITPLTTKTADIVSNGGTTIDSSIFVGTTDISKITVGDGLKWNDIRDTQNETTPSPVSPSGKWYSATSGKAYDSADLPDRTADTYVSDTALLPMKAFAVYSIDDGSLNFYKRRICDIPATGDIFEGKNVTNVYMGFEKDAYTGSWPNDDCPWFDIAPQVKSVSSIDVIKPKSMAWRFNNFAACTSFDLGNVDTSECVSLRRLFSGCSSCISITGLDTWDTSNVADLSATFDYLIRLKTIPGISGWNTGNVKYFARTFYNLYGLERLDLSNWDDSSLIPGTLVDGIGYSEDIFNSKYGTVKSLKSFSIGAKWSHTSNLAQGIEQAGTAPVDGKWYAASDGHGYAPADIPSGKADTYVASRSLLSNVAFAVYSADDSSLDFYKRPRYLMPVSGSMFNGKQATEVYPDIEDYNFDINSDNVGNAPWWSHRADILSVKVVDSIKPKNMTGWFYWFINVTSIDLGPIDTSENTSLFGTFDRCFKLQTIDVSMMNTSKVRSMGCAFYGDGELTRLDISNWNISNVNDFSYMFIDCKKLGVLNMPPSPKFSSQIDFIGYMFLHCENLNLDCSDWNVPVSADHPRFNDGAPGVILPKVWQTTTSAVYSSNETKRLTSINS